MIRCDHRRQTYLITNDSVNITWPRSGKIDGTCGHAIRTHCPSLGAFV